MRAFGGLEIRANTAAGIVPAAVAKVTAAVAGSAWTANAVTAHGNLGVVPDVTNSRLTLKPGIYEIVFNACIEGATVGGTSGDATGNINFRLYQGGVASGILCPSQITDASTKTQVTMMGLVEVTQAQADAGTNYVEVYANADDASGNDIIVREAQFYAKHID